MSEDLDFGFITKSDKNFYEGLIALLASLRAWHPGREVVVVDCGLLPEQLRAVARYPAVRVIPARGGFEIPERMRHYYTPAVYGFFSAHIAMRPIAIHIDADAVVLGDLTDLAASTVGGEVGISAVPDYPNLDLTFQIGDVDGATDALRTVVGDLDLGSISFNGGVFAVREDYYREHMLPWVHRLIPHHRLFWGNDMAIMNFAACAANRRQPFNVMPHIYNTRAFYRRASDLAPNRLRRGRDVPPQLDGPFGRVRILHFVGRGKPWMHPGPQDDSSEAWWYFRRLGRDWFEQRD